MKSQTHIFLAIACGLLMLYSCSSTGVNPTGLMGAQVMCPTGPRPTLDCRGVLQQYARDLKADLNAMSKVQVGLALTTTKLTEADALTSDLLQHSYQTCTLYNACIIPPEEYAARQQQLQNVQLEVRRALVGSGLGFGQQNIQINPGSPPGQPFPGQGIPGQPLPGQQIPGQGFPGQPLPGQPFPGAVQPGGDFPGSFDPNIPQPGFPPAQNFPPQPGQGGGPALAMNVPSSTGAQLGDSILNTLRDGSNQVRGVGTTAASVAKSTAAKQPTQDLDTILRGMVQNLRQETAKKSPSAAAGRVVVGSVNEENRPWGSPWGAILQERLSSIVVSEKQFKQAVTPRMRGITVTDVAKVDDPNDPKSLASLYGADIAITGTYQPQGENILVKLTAFHGGNVIAQTNRTISKAVLPDVVADTPVNAADTSQLLDSLNQLGPRADGVVSITTTQPGAGSSYRLGEEITFLVNAKLDGHLYLFHMDAEKNVSVIFPNQFQPQAVVRAGQVLQVPSPGAGFKFEASPPFGLETTSAIVTATPLSVTDLGHVKNGLAGQKQELLKVASFRGIATVQSDTSPGAVAVRWNSVTVLVRP